MEQVNVRHVKVQVADFGLWKFVVFVLAAAVVVPWVLPLVVFARTKQPVKVPLALVAIEPTVVFGCMVGQGLDLVH
jgi:hypothetical protein